MFLKPREKGIWYGTERPHTAVGVLRGMFVLQRTYIQTVPYLCAHLVTIGPNSFLLLYLVYFSGKTEYQTTKTSKARRSTSFERRPSKRYSRRTLQMKGDVRAVLPRQLSMSGSGWFGRRIPWQSLVIARSPRVHVWYSQSHKITWGKWLLPLADMKPALDPSADGVWGCV